MMDVEPCDIVYLESLEKENDQLREDIRQLVAKAITIRDLAIRNGTLCADFGTELAGVMADAFFEMLKDAKNYVEMQFTATNGERVTVTVQRHGGQTPHELRLEAEADAEYWKSEACS